MGGWDGYDLNDVFAAQVDRLISADRQDDGSANKADSIQYPTHRFTGPPL